MNHREPIRVLFLDHVARLSGAEQSLAELVIGLAKGPVEPIVVLPGDGPLATKLREHGILVRKVPMSKRMLHTSRRSLMRMPFVAVVRLWAFLVASWRIFRIVREMQPDVIHSNTLKTHFLSIIPAKLSRTPLIWHVRDILPRGWLRRALCFFARTPRLIVVPSRSIANGFGRKNKKVYKKLRLIPNGVRVDEIYEGVRSGAGKALRSEIGANGHPVVGIVGRIAPWKGQEVFVRAAAMLTEHYPKTRFAVIGAPMFGEQDALFMQRLQDAVAEAELSDRIVFLGWRSTVEAMAAIDILVHASLEPEPFGRTIIEAMAAGKPVVAGASGAVRELVPPEAGIVIPPGKVEILADALDTLLSDKAMREHMGQAGLEIAHGYFDVRRTVAGVGAMYAEITRKRRVARRPRRTTTRKPGRMSWPAAPQTERFEPTIAPVDAPSADAPLPRRSRRSDVRRLVARIEAPRKMAASEPAIARPSGNRDAFAARIDAPSPQKTTNGNGNGNGHGNGNGNGNGHKRKDNVTVPALKQKTAQRRTLPETTPAAPTPPALRREAPVPVTSAERAVPMRVIPVVEAPVAPVPVTVPRKALYEISKRLIDVIVAGAVLLVGAPAWIVVALLIKLDSPGSVLFKNTVMGRHGVPFTYYKFRSMRNDLGDDQHREFIQRYVTENDGVHHEGEKVFKLVGDPRVTSVGKWIRKLSIDEVPQLLNVLKGQMSIVGPRPPLQYEFELYDGYAMQRLAVPPGLTGLQQVAARHTASFKDKIEMDLDYIRRRSTLMDIGIMLRSIPAALRGE